MSRPFDADAALAAYFAGELDDADRRALRAWLDAHPEQIGAVADEALIHGTLGTMLAGRGAAAADEADDQPWHTLPVAIPHRPLWRIGAWAIAATLVLASGAAIYLAATRSPISPTDAGGPIAMVIDATPDATLVVNDAVARPGDEVRSGEMTLDTGSADFRLSSGVSVQLRGDTRIVVRDPMTASLHRGSAVFDCPHTAKGYTVHLPGGARIVDLGTRFQVTVREDGTRLLAVTEGRVSFDTPARSILVEEGTIATLDAADTLTLRPTASHFIRQSPLNDVSMVLAYAFDTGIDDDGGVTYPNLARATGASLDLHVPDRLDSPTRIDGRDGFDAALRFDASRKQHVMLAADSVLRLSGSMTVAFWVRLPSPGPRGGRCTLLAYGTTGEAPQTNLLYRVGYEKGELAMFHESGSGADHALRVAPTADPDRWSQVVMVRNAERKTLAIYEDGRLLASDTYDAGPTGGDGPQSAAAIGRLGGGDAEYLDGEVGSIFVWSRALTDREIDRLRQQGETEPGITEIAQ